MSDLTSGQVLSAAREAAGLSLREVADALNLQIHTLEAIEQDAADRLPADVFTRGYIRAYAKYLGLESGPWTQAPVAQPPPVEQPNAQPKRRFAIEQNHLIGGALGLVIIIVLAIWLFSDSSDDTPPAVNNEEVAGAGVAPAAREIDAARETGVAERTGAAVETTTGEAVAAGELVAAGQDGENIGAGPATVQTEVDEPGTAQVAAA
ncbi:MAG: helix-turn-helix domain-containing protein, partial [Pseudomonadales bacterium]